MPTIIFENETDIPADLRGEAKQTDDGNFQLDADRLLNKNKDLLGKIAKLQRKVDDAETARTEAEAKASEYKSNPVIPKGKRLVDVSDAELVETLKADGLTKESFAELKTRAETAESKLAETQVETTALEAGKDKAAWREHAAANNLRFDTRTEEDKTFPVVLFKDAEGKETEMKLEDYKTEKAAHVKDAENAQQQPPPVKQWGVQVSGKEQKPPNIVEQEIQAAIATGRYNL